MHLPLTVRRRDSHPMPKATPARDALLSELRVRERMALDRLGAAVGGLSVCAISRAGGSTPAAKYHEGSVAALAEAWRAVQRAGGGATDDWARVREVRAHWLMQVGTVGRAGADWTGYLTGGLDALDLLEHLPDDEGRGVDDLQN